MKNDLAKLFSSIAFMNNLIQLQGVSIISYVFEERNMAGLLIQ